MRNHASCLSAAVLMAIGGAHVAHADAEMLNTYCSACHTETESGLSRISEPTQKP